MHDEPSTSKAICQSCYENNITSFTVPYIMDNGRKEKWKEMFKDLPKDTQDEILNNFGEPQTSFYH